MKKEYYDEQKANYIREKLSKTAINKVFHPLIVDIMLRRQFEYELDDTIFNRDLDTFLDNVKTIAIEEMDTEKTGRVGAFSERKRNIRIASDLFREDNIDYEQIYEALAHETVHAMRFEKVGIRKREDRVFQDRIDNEKAGIREAFTECEADALVYNTPNTDFKIINLRQTNCYPDLTPFIDLIVATFGVKRKDLLSECLKGKEDLNKLLSKALDKTNQSSDANTIFIKISTSVSTIYREMNKEDSIEKEREDNIKDAIVNMFNAAEDGIDKRISNLQVNNIDKFKEEFEHIKLDQKIIRKITREGAANCSHREKEIAQEIAEKYNQINTKMRCIHEILESDVLKNKPELLQTLQQKQTIEEINDFMYANVITLDLNKEIKISEDVMKEHNLECSSYEMEWDNTGIIQYIQHNQEEIMKTENTQKTGQKILNSLKNYIFNSKNNGPKLLAERNEPIKAQNHSWDLENWGIDREQFMQDSQEKIKESIENQQQVGQKINTEELEVHSAHEEI